MWVAKSSLTGWRSNTITKVVVKKDLSFNFIELQNLKRIVRVNRYSYKAIMQRQANTFVGVFKDSKDLEAYKGVRGMPWLSKETKDVLSCEKLRGVARER